MKRLTAKRLQQPHLGITLNDLVLLPQQLPGKRYPWAWSQLKKVLPPSVVAYFQQLPWGHLASGCYVNVRDQFVYWIEQSNRMPADDGDIPIIEISAGHLHVALKGDWWSALPKTIKADFCHFAWREQATLIVPSLERTGIGYIILEDGFIDQTITALRVFRLSTIKQLAYLTDPVIHYLNGGTARAVTFDHTRFLHSLDVLAIATCIGWNIGLRDAKLRCLQFAALTHDILTPAGGDATKRISPVELDEDANFRKVFDLNGFAKIEMKYQLDRDLIFATIQNDGLLGQILDIADKLAYVSRDLPCYLIHNEPKNLERELLPNEYGKLTQITKHTPMLCSVWDSFRRVGNNIVSNSPKRLADFLFVRILLFRQFYANPAGRFHEATSIRLALEHLLKQGAISVHQLLEMGDRSLEHLLGKVLGCFEWDVLSAKTVGEPGFRTFTTEQMARDFVVQLHNKNQYPLLIEHLQPYMKRSSNKFYVKAKGVSHQLLSDAYPDLDNELKRAELLPEPWAVYWLKSFQPGISELFRQLVSDNMLRQFNLSPQ